MTAERPNVLLVVMDSVRAANTSLHGHENETTPFLETFADRATVYEQARAPGSWSLPSHVSLFTGHHVAEHGVVEPSHRLEPGHTVFERLGDAGYDTAVFSENPWLTAVDAGLDAGFDVVEGSRNVPFPDALDPVEFTAAEGHGEYGAFLRAALDDEFPLRSLLNGVYNKVAWDAPWLLPGDAAASAPAPEYGDLFLEWSAGRDRPWAACVNFMDAHAPYEPSAEHDRWGGAKLRSLQNEIEKPVWSFHGGEDPWWQASALEALYDGTIRQIDDELRRVLGVLEERGELSETLVVVTSDHGEGFGEPSLLKPSTRVVGHVEGIHERLLHVPLVVKRPGQADDRRVSAPATLTRFPAVVDATLEGRRVDFVPDDKVVASSEGLTAPNMRLAEEYCGEDECWRFRGTMRAVYDDGEQVRKTATWREHAVQVSCVDAKSHYVSGRDGAAGERVETTFESFDDAGVREAHDLDDVDDAVERRLEDLGYA